MIHWEPTDEDVQWTSNMINMLVDGGRWAVPASESIFIIHKQGKEYELQGDVTHECNQKIMIVFSRLGYKAKVQSN
jgi:hypothetical protein